MPFNCKGYRVDYIISSYSSEKTNTFKAGWPDFDYENLVGIRLVLKSQTDYGNSLALSLYVNGDEIPLEYGSSQKGTWEYELCAGFRKSITSKDYRSLETRIVLAAGNGSIIPVTGKLFISLFAAPASESATTHGEYDKRRREDSADGRSRRC